MTQAIKFPPSYESPGLHAWIPTLTLLQASGELTVMLVCLSLFLQLINLKRQRKQDQGPSVKVTLTAVSL